jgi:hypothetical protein
MNVWKTRSCRLHIAVLERSTGKDMEKKKKKKKTTFRRNCNSISLRWPTKTTTNLNQTISLWSKGPRAGTWSAQTATMWRWGAAKIYTFYFPTERDICRSCIGISDLSPQLCPGHVFPIFVGFCVVVFCKENLDENIFFPRDFLTLQNRREIWHKSQRKTGTRNARRKSLPATHC